MVRLPDRIVMSLALFVGSDAATTVLDDAGTPFAATFIAGTGATVPSVLSSLTVVSVSVTLMPLSLIFGVPIAFLVTFRPLCLF